MKAKDFFHSRRYSVDEYFDYTGRLGTGLTRQNCPQELFAIIAIMAEDCGYHLTELRSDFTRVFIRGYDRHKQMGNNLMLRVSDGDLVVAVIGFIHQRQGYMTRLYNALRKIRRRYKLNRIIIESPNEKMRAWCKKNGFQQDPYIRNNYVEQR